MYGMCSIPDLYVWYIIYFQASPVLGNSNELLWCWNETLGAGELCSRQAILRWGTKIMMGKCIIYPGISSAMYLELYNNNNKNLYR